jgi:hypothetical protein
MLLFLARTFNKEKRLTRIMPYNTTGASHMEGVKNEKDIVYSLNVTNGSSLKLDELYGGAMHFKQIGGTKSVSDMDGFSAASEERKCGVSIKKHKVGTGTFDYVNTSKLKDYLPEESVNRIKSGILDIRRRYHGDESKINIARNEKNILLDQEFVHFTDVVIKSLLKKINSRNPELIIVNDVQNRKLKCYKESSFHELAVEPYNVSNVYTLKKGRGKTSRSILRNGVSINLRLRIELNNGVGALLGGFGKKNKNSSVTIKVQQESVDKLLATTELYSECEY